MKGQVSEVELSKGQPNFCTKWRRILETFGTLPGQEYLAIHNSNIKEV